MTISDRQLPQGTCESLLTAAPFPAAILEGADYKVRFANGRFLELVGSRRLSGRSFAEVLPELGDIIPILDRLRTRQSQNHSSLQPVRIQQHWQIRGSSEGHEIYLQPFARVGDLESAVGLFVQPSANSEVPYLGSLQAQDLVHLAEASRSLLAVASLETEAAYYLRVNSTFTNLLGWTQEEMLAQPVTAFVHPDDVPATLSEVAKLAHGETSARFENRLRHKNGSYRWISWAAAPAPKEGLVYSTGIDITESKQAETILRQQAKANEFRVALADAIRPLETSTELRKRAAKVVAEYFQVARVNFSRRQPERDTLIIDEEYAEGVPSGLGEHRISSFGPMASDPTPILAIENVAEDPRLTAEQKEGYKHFKIASFVSVRLISKGDILATFVVADRRPRKWSKEDVALIREAAEHIWTASERADAEDALHAANAQLIENDLRKNEFLAMLAHELRNPLAAVRNAVQLLAIGVPDEQAGQRYVDILRRQADVLSSLVDELLDVSRVTRGLISLRQERVDLTDIAARAVEGVRVLVETKQQELNITLPHKSVMVMGDPLRLEQVLVNLLTNAAKYTDPKGKISLVIETDQDWAQVQVIDTGIGIAPETQERIFDLFGQAERGLDRAQGGLGIGLTIAKTIVELHGGHIEVHSAGLGQGAEFIVKLPQIPIAPEVDAPAAQMPAADGAAKRVLVVEDMPDVAETLSLLIESLGHQVTSARDGQAALAKAEEFHPDLVLLDIGLPGMDGYEIVRRLRQNPRTHDLTVAALTGYGQESDRELTKAAGFDAHFVKPVDFQTLAEFINRTQPAVH